MAEVSHGCDFFRDAPGARPDARRTPALRIMCVGADAAAGESDLPQHGRECCGGPGNLFAERTALCAPAEDEFRAVRLPVLGKCPDGVSGDSRD